MSDGEENLMKRIVLLLATIAATVSLALASLTAGSVVSFGAQPASAQSAAQDGPWVWGWNAWGQLGDGTYTDVYAPAQVTGLSNVTDVSAGELSSVVVKSDGTVWGWGPNWNGQLGNGTNTDSNTPVQVSGLTDVKAISAGYVHNLALKSNGTVWGWGWNQNGELGNGTNTDSNTPVQVSGLTDVKAIAAGAYHSLALKNDGTVWAWGADGTGQLGDSTNPEGTYPNSNIPVRVSGLTDVKAIDASGEHSVALKNDGTVWAWGWNYYGQLGDGTKVDSHIPVRVSGLTDVGAIDAGWYHNAALKNDGTVWAWGWNYYGQLGDGTSADSNTPVQVGGLSGATHVTVGSYHTAALKSDGTAWAWGDNQFGQLGDGTDTATNTPVRVSGIASVKKVSAGGRHTMALAEKAPDITPPEVSSTIPTHNASGVATTANVSATFFEEGSGIDPDTLTTDTFKVVQVKPTGNVPVAGTVTYDESSQTATFDPSSNLTKGLYRATITTGVEDRAGNALTNRYAWTFATAGPSRK
jgi:alpha-tubulin suppressor-like RCC1 family protein